MEKTECPHCGRVLEADQTQGVCSSDDCPRHETKPKRGPRTQGDALRRINAVLAAALVDIDDYLAHPRLVGNLRAIPEVRGGVADALETVRWLQRVDSWQEKKV